PDQRWGTACGAEVSASAANCFGSSLPCSRDSAGFVGFHSCSAFACAAAAARLTLCCFCCSSSSRQQQQQGAVRAAGGGCCRSRFCSCSCSSSSSTNLHCSCFQQHG